MSYIDNNITIEDIKQAISDKEQDIVDAMERLLDGIEGAAKPTPKPLFIVESFGEIVARGYVGGHVEQGEGYVSTDKCILDKLSGRIAGLQPGDDTQLLVHVTCGDYHTYKSLGAKRDAIGVLLGLNARATR